MGDNKNIRDGRDRSKVDSKDRSEIEFLHRKFPRFSHPQIIEAIKAAGPLRRDIEEYLEWK